MFLVSRDISDYILDGKPILQRNGTEESVRTNYEIVLQIGSCLRNGRNIVLI